MTDNTYSGSAASLETQLSSVIAPAMLANILSSIPIGSDGSYSVATSNGSSSLNVSGLDAAIVNNDPATIASLLGSSPNAAGGFDNIGAFATDVTNTGSAPVTVVATTPAFMELQGSETVAGGTVSPFIADASHDSSAVKLEAGAGSSFVIGGSGSDTLTGSTSASGHAILVAGSGPTTMTGGLGADSLYGGGNTTMTGGSGAYQLLADYTANAHDSISAGTGGSQTLAVASGSNTLKDTGGINDSLYAGSGSDTLYGSTSGTTDALYQGNSTVISTGSDTISVAAATTAHTDTITASTAPGALDTVSFAGYSAAQVQALVSAAPNVGDSVTIKFGSGTTLLTATLNNVSHITFK